MIRPSAALVLCGVAMSVAALGGCTSSAPPEGEPTFYQNLAQPDVTVDAAAAASMISGYRSNNGLGAVTVDPELMRMAGEQAHAMAAHDKMDHDIGAPVPGADPQFAVRRQRRGREHFRRLSHARRGFFRLARFAAAPRQHAQSRRHAPRHRRGLCAGLQI